MSLEFVSLGNDNSGEIPAGYDLVVVESVDVADGTFESAIILYGFDEIGLFDNDFDIPVYGYLEIAGGESFGVSV